MDALDHLCARLSHLEPAIDSPAKWAGSSTVKEFFRKELDHKAILMASISSARIQESAKASYWHDNGFVKIVLLNTQYYKLRLHIWDCRHYVHPMISNVHNHRWPFYSVMLSGCYVHELFDVTAEGTAYFNYDYEHAEGGAYELIEKGKIYLNRTADHIFQRGECYFQGCEQLHRVTAFPGQVVVSMILQGKAIRKRSTVCTRAPWRGDTVRPQTALHDKVVVEHVGLALDRMMQAST